MTEEETPVVAGIDMTFNNCTFVIQITREAFVSLIHSLVEEGVLTPRTADFLIRKDEEHDERS